MSAGRSVRATSLPNASAKVLLFFEMTKPKKGFRTVMAQNPGKSNLIESDVCEYAVLLLGHGDAASEHLGLVGATRAVLSFFGLEEGTVGGVSPVGGEDFGVLGFGEFVAEQFGLAVVTDVLGMFTLAAIVQIVLLSF